MLLLWNYLFSVIFSVGLLKTGIFARSFNKKRTFGSQNLRKQTAIAS
jgi:hypothetical protein